MSAPENPIDAELKMMEDMLADLCAAISQIVKARYPAMAADRRFNFAYCMAVRLIRNHVQTEFGEPKPQDTYRQN